MNEKQHSYLSPKLAVMPRLPVEGLGVFAVKHVLRGELVALWSGRVVQEAEFNRLPPRERQLSVQVEDEFYLVPNRLGEPADYVNHSCNPNAGMGGQIAVVAMRDILPGEEVCIDYAMCDGSRYDEFECTCGSENCRRVVRGTDWQNPALWQRYAGYFSPYLQRRIELLSLVQQAQRPVEMATVF